MGKEMEDMRFAMATTTLILPPHLMIRERTTLGVSANQLVVEFQLPTACMDLISFMK